MLCDLCHKSPATVHLTEIVNDQVTELHICQECAQHKTEELKQQLSISDFLSGLVTQEAAAEIDERRRCPSCGISFAEFKKRGRLGCSHCYAVFKPQLIPLIKKIHGATRHKGKLPANVEEGVVFDKNIKALHERLERAVQLEEYEEAARLRDAIRELEKKKSNNV